MGQCQCCGEIILNKFREDDERTHEVENKVEDKLKLESDVEFLHQNVTSNVEPGPTHSPTSVN